MIIMLVYGSLSTDRSPWPHRFTPTTIITLAWSLITDEDVIVSPCVYINRHTYGCHVCLLTPGLDWWYKSAPVCDFAVRPSSVRACVQLDFCRGLSHTGKSRSRDPDVTWENVGELFKSPLHADIAIYNKRHADKMSRWSKQTGCLKKHVIALIGLIPIKCVRIICVCVWSLLISMLCVLKLEIFFNRRFLIMMNNSIRY